MYLLHCRFYNNTNRNQPTCNYVSPFCITNSLWTLIINCIQHARYKGKGKRTCIAPLMKLHLKALRYGSHRITLQTTPYLPLLCEHSPDGATWIAIPARYSFIDPGRMKGWVGLVGWHNSGRYTHISGHTSVADRAEARESSPVRDRRSNHWATQPTNKIYNSYICYIKHKQNRK